MTGKRAAPLLEMSGVALAFGATRALDGVDFDLRAGEVHALIGENGAGKSSLMKVLAGVHRPDRGRMSLAGREYRPAGPIDALRSGVAMIYQELTVLPHLTVAENAMLGREERGPLGVLRRRRMRPRVAEALALLEHGELPLDARVGDLGPAARQIVEIGRALLADARVLVMDEPTSSLGAADVDRLLAVVRRLSAGGRAVVYISHFLEEVRRVSDRYTVLRDGRSVASGAVAEVADGELVRQMVGRQLDQVFPPRRPGGGDVVLSATAVAGEGRPQAATFELRAGEILGIGGLCGSGRSELLEVVFGLRPRTGGGLRLRGEPLAGGIALRWRRGMGFVVEDRKTRGLAASRSIADNITLPSLHRLARAGVIDRPRQRDAVATWIDRLAIQCRGPGQRVVELSGGNQQRVALARLLQAEADVLLLDEPTRGIDVHSRLDIYRLLDRLARQGRAILVVSSYLPELLGLCDRIAVMRGGVLGPARPAAEWDQESLLRAALEVSA